MFMLTVVALLLSLGLLAWVLQLRMQLVRLERETARLAESVALQAPPALREAPGTPMRISIEILNPVELARKESWFAGAFGSLTPALLRRIVYARTLTIMQQQLEQFHVKADVRLTGDA